MDMEPRRRRGDLLDILEEEQEKGDEEIAAQIERDRLCFIRNYDMLKKWFPDEWLAISRGRIVAHHEKLPEVYRELGRVRVDNAYIDRTYVGKIPPALIYPQIA